MSKFFILSFLLAISFCETADVSVNDCPEVSPCYHVYRIITLTVRDGAGNPLVLDSYYSLNKATGEKYELSSDYNATGSYPVLTDSQRKEVAKSGTEIEFHGTVAGKSFITTFTIGHDCCHIVKMEGEEEVVFSGGE